MGKAVRHELGKIYARGIGTLNDCVVVDIKGLPSAKASELRAHLRADGVKMRVVHNRVALKSLPVKDPAQLKPLLKGMVGVITGGGDVVALTKSVIEWRRKYKNKLLEIRGGMVDGRPIDAKGVTDVSRMAGKQELRGKIVGCIAGNLQRIVAVIGGPQRGVLYAVQAHQKALAAKS